MIDGEPGRTSPERAWDDKGDSVTLERTASRPSGDPAALIEKILDGDSRAEEDLVARYSRGVSLLLRRLARSPSLAEDLHQETFRVVLEKARGGAIREPEKLAGFIRSTAKNLLLAHRRKEARYDDLGNEAERRTPAGQLDRVLRDEEAVRVRELLGELRFDRDRQLLVRFYLSDDSKHEICRDLEVDPGRFNRVLHRARQRLRELWERSEKRRLLFSEDG